MLYYFTKGKTATEMQKKKICAMYREDAVMIECVKSGCKVSCWRFLTGQCSTVGWVDQLKLIAIKSRH